MPDSPAIAVDAVHALARALAAELPEIDPVRILLAVERAAASLEPAPDFDWERMVHVHLDRIAGVEAGPDSAAILRELADDLEDAIGDPGRALTARLGAFAEAAAACDLDPLLRLARATDRWRELPLDAMSALARRGDDASRARWFAGIAEGWERVGAAYRAADCHECVLSVRPDDARAHDALERIYRDGGEHSQLVELLRRRAERTELDSAMRAALFAELGALYERALGDALAAFDAYRHADRLAPDQAEILEALARTAIAADAHDDALGALVRLARVTVDAAPRARVLHRAAEIAWRAMHDADAANDLLTRALAADADFAAAVDALAALRRDRGELAGALELLLDAAKRPALAADRTRFSGDAAALCAELGDAARALELYRAVREADPGDRRAALALAELLWDERALDELAPILRELCASTHEPRRLHAYLLRQAEVATARGEPEVARDALARALALDPDDASPRRALAEILFERGAWAEARPLIRELLDLEDALPRSACVELHLRAALCARAEHDDADAARHCAIALALDPAHRDTLLLKLELDAGDPVAQVSTHLALADGAPPDEKAARYAALGDLYASRLADPSTAREMYREALACKPSDHVLLTKSLGLIAGEGDWAYGLDLVQRLIDTEIDPTVRARYRHLAAMILRDELARPAAAADELARAIEDAPLAFAAADDLEALYAKQADPDRVLRFFYRRLEQLRTDEGRAGELVRLWDKLAALCLALGRRDDARCAYEVALSLEPDDPARRQRLAELYVAGGPDHYEDAIAQHQDILDEHRGRTASYEALAMLYAQTGRPRHAKACEQALAIIGVRAVSAAKPGASRALTIGAPIPIGQDGWWALSGDVDLQLSGLFALVAPVVAAERARLRPPPRHAPGSSRLDDDRPVARVLRRAIGALDLARPPIYVDRDQAAACRVTLRARDGALAPAVVLGAAALAAGVDERALAFTIARRLADLRPDRFARLLCPRADDLAQMIDLALALAVGSATPAGDARGRAARWLAASLAPVALDQVVRLGQKLRDRRVDAGRAALDWLEATERAGDRIGLVVAGDLPACVRVLEAEPASTTHPRERILALVRASVRDDVLAVRARLERWPQAASSAIPDHAAR